MGREARRVERAGPGARGRGDATPNPTGRAERAGQGRERGTRPVQSPRERTPGSTHGAETAEAASRRRAARQAPAGAQAPGVPTDDVRADRGQGARADRRDPTAPGGGPEAREVARGERGRPEDEGRVEVREGPRRRRPQTRLGAGGEGSDRARSDDRAIRTGGQPAPRGGPGARG